MKTTLLNIHLFRSDFVQFKMPSFSFTTLFFSSFLTFSSEDALALINSLFLQPYLKNPKLTPSSGLCLKPTDKPCLFHVNPLLDPSASLCSCRSPPLFSYTVTVCTIVLTSDSYTDTNSYISVKKIKNKNSI